MKTSVQRLAGNIRKILKGRGITLNAFGDEIGSRTQLYAVLRGTANPTLRWIERAAEALNRDAWELLK